MKFLWLAVLLAGCVHLRPENRDHFAHLKVVAGKLGVEPSVLNWVSLESEAVCNSIDSKVTGWTATAVVSGVLSGGGGIAATVIDERTPRWATGSVTVVLAVMTGLSGYLSTHYAQRYAQKCTVNTGGK